MKTRTALYLVVLVVSIGLLGWGIRTEGAKPGRCHVQREGGRWATCTPDEQARCEDLRQDYGIRTCVWPLNPGQVSPSR